MAYYTHDSSSQLQAYFWKLSGFARTGFAAYDHHLVISNCARKVFALLHYRKVGGEF